MGVEPAYPVGHAEKGKGRLVVSTKIIQGHGSAMGIGSFDSSKCKGTLVRDRVQGFVGDRARQFISYSCPGYRGISGEGV